MDNVTLEEFRTSMNLLARALMAQANSEAVENSIGGICAYRITEFLRMNPLEFSGSKVEEDPNGFIKEVYKTLAIIRLTVASRLSIERCRSSLV